LEQPSNNCEACKDGLDGARASAARSAAYEKRRMQQRVAKQLDLDTDWVCTSDADGKGSGQEKENPADIMKMLWTVENLLTVETEWVR
jgi:hypothetical protein